MNHSNLGPRTSAVADQPVSLRVTCPVVSRIEMILRIERVMSTRQQLHACDLVTFASDLCRH